MERLPRNHPEVVSLLTQLQGVRFQQMSTPEMYFTVEHLRDELFRRGWNSRLAADGVTVELFPAEEVG